jgi:putative membrane protein
MKKLLSMFTVIGLVFSGAAVLRAADTSTTVPTPTEAKVLADLHHTNQMEIRMGELAQKRGSSDAVKKFGDTLVKDHSDADKKVKDVASAENIKLEDEKMPMGKEKEMDSKLHSLQGKSFDLAFAQDMVKGHHDAVEQLQAAQGKLAGTPTGDLVKTLLPVIEQHEKIARDLVASSK